MVEVLLTNAAALTGGATIEEAIYISYFSMAKISGGSMPRSGILLEILLFSFNLI